ncbi:MAG: F0F1 ATP synthase subunit delta [Actinomycetota bacterium]
MLIDWFTVLAQLVNFVILLVVLKFLLYDRILEAMDKRRASFAEREETTERLRREAEEETRRLEERRKEIEANWEDMIEEARREAEDRRRELMEEARTEVEHQERQWRDSVRSNQDRLLTELERSTGEQAIAISRRALQDLADADLEGEMVREFAHRLEEAKSDDAEIAATLRESDHPLTVYTSFELDETSRQTIRETLRDLVGDPGREIEWERDPDLVAGVVVRVGARRVGWTIDQYLEALRGAFEAVVRSHMEAPGDIDELQPDASTEAEAS